MTLLLLSGARLPTARVVILPAAATPLNRCRAPRARSRLVQTVFLERAARLAPLRVRTDHVGYDDASSPLSATCCNVERDRRHGLAAACTRRSTLKSPVRPDEDVGYQTHSREAGGARAGEAGVAQRFTVALLEEEFGGEARFRGRRR